MYDVIILGSGPAGLTAGIYSVRAGHKTLIIAGLKWGGQLMSTTLVENYPGFSDGIQGPALMMNMRKQAERLGAEFVNAEFTSTDFSKKPFEITANSKVYQGKTVIIATGADPIWLDVPGEKELRGKGVSECATCDAFFFRGKNVIVVGGGDSCMEDAHVLANVVNSVTIVHRRDSFRASRASQEMVLKNPKVKVLWNKTITKYIGANKLEAVVLKDTTTGKEKEMKIDGVFVAIGHKPNTTLFKGVQLDKRGYIERKEKYNVAGLLKYFTATTVPGVFTAGDVHDYRYRQAITASAFGCMAALDADLWLSEQK
jgi:thioredoxin reductase (NADPH)